MRLTQLRNFNREGNLGTCRRVEQAWRSLGTHGHYGTGSSPEQPGEYLTPMERRVDELLARSRPRT